MSSNALSMSPFDSIGCRILRADTSVSLSLVSERETTRRTGMSHSGFHFSRVLPAIHVANDSFNHVSFHQASVTRSPDHWCAVSWAQMEDHLGRKYGVSWHGLASSIVSL